MFNKGYLWFQNPKGFLLDLLEYVRVYQPSLTGDEPCDPERNERVTMALQALSNVINSNPGKIDIDTATILKLNFLEDCCKCY